MSNHFIYSVIFLAGLFAAFSLIYVTAQGGVTAPNPGHTGIEVEVDVGNGDESVQAVADDLNTKANNFETRITALENSGGGTTPPPTPGGSGTCIELITPIIFNSGGPAQEQFIDLPIECFGRGCTLMIERIVGGSILNTNFVIFSQSPNLNSIGAKYWEVAGGSSGNNGGSNSEIIATVSTSISLIDDSTNVPSESDPDKIVLRAGTSSQSYLAKLYHCT